MQISLSKREDKVIKSTLEAARQKGMPFNDDQEELLRTALVEMVKGLPPYVVEHLPKDIVLFVTGESDLGKAIVTEVKLTIADAIYTVAYGELDKQCYGCEIKRHEL